MPSYHCTCDVYPYSLSNSVASVCDDLGGANNAQCVLTSATITASDYEALGITPGQIGYSWGWGFGVVLFFYLLGHAYGVISNLLNRY